MSTAIQHNQVPPACGDARTGTIAFDTWCLGAYARNHGVYVYAGKLLEHFRELAPEYGVEVAPYASRGVDEAEDSNWRPAPGYSPRETGLLRWQRVWRYGGACALAAKQKMDLVFSPHCVSLYLRKLTPHVVTIHDVIPLLMPVVPRRVRRMLRFCSWWSATFSRAVITPSVHSKRDLLNAYKLPENKVKVVHMAYDKTVFNGAPVDPERFKALAAKAGIQGPYILHHGMIKRNKNLKRLVQSFHRLIERNRNLDVNLVLVGERGWDFEEVVEAAHQAPERVIFTGPVPLADLAMLIKGASLAVFPSLYEGFCLPMIEAMACGVPTIAANSSCLPEISGGVLRYFDPGSVEEMSACMEEALENEGLSRELSERGAVHVQQFDWRRCARETLNVLTEQLGHPPRRD